MFRCMQYSASNGYSNDPVMADYKSFGFAGVVSKKDIAGIE